MVQFSAPSYLFVRGRFSQVPLHLTTATCGAASATSLPIILAAFDITSAPPTGQYSFEISSEVTIASAKALQPG